MGSGQSGDPVADDAAKVDVFDPIAVYVDFKVTRQSFYLLGNTAFRSVSLV
jgi:hypothetical protein